MSSSREMFDVLGRELVRAGLELAGKSIEEVREELRWELSRLVLCLESPSAGRADFSELLSRIAVDSPSTPEVGPLESLGDLLSSTGAATKQLTSETTRPLTSLPDGSLDALGLLGIGLVKVLALLQSGQLQSDDLRVTLKKYFPDDRQAEQILQALLDLAR